MPRKNREKYIGWAEAACGVGFLVGPLIGAVLYSIGGYVLPFATFAATYMITYPYIAYVVCCSV
jgi:MFS family permease